MHFTSASVLGAVVFMTLHLLCAGEISRRKKQVIQTHVYSHYHPDH